MAGFWGEIQYYLSLEAFGKLTPVQYSTVRTCYDSLLEEFLSEAGQEAVDAFPGDLPQVGVSRAGVCAVEDTCCVHHQQHVLQGLWDGLQLGTNMCHVFATMSPKAHFHIVFVFKNSQKKKNLFYNNLPNCQNITNGKHHSSPSLRYTDLKALQQVTSNAQVGLRPCCWRSSALSQLRHRARC